MSTVVVSNPKNFTKDDEWLFPETIYQSFEPVIHLLENVFVCKSGIVFKNLLLVKSSVFAYKYLYLTFYKIGLINIFLYKKVNLNPNNKYLLIHNLWCRGYYHWICEALPRLWAAKIYADDATILLPDSYKGFQLESLQIAGFKKIIFYKSGQVFKVKELVMPSNPERLYVPNPAVCLAIRHFYINSILSNDKVSATKKIEKIYISRGKAKLRKVVNEEAVKQILERNGFEVVHLEDYTFYEQVRLMSSVKYLISNHGAGLTNMHFMPGGGSILELYKRRVPKIDWGRGLRTDLPSTCYLRLASALGHEYRMQFCDAADPKIPSGKADIIVDTAMLQSNINSMISN